MSGATALWWPNRGCPDDRSERAATGASGAHVLSWPGGGSPRGHCGHRREGRDRGLPRRPPARSRDGRASMTGLAAVASVTLTYLLAALFRRRHRVPRAGRETTDALWDTGTAVAAVLVPLPPRPPGLAAPAAPRPPPPPRAPRPAPP